MIKNKINIKTIIITTLYVFFILNNLSPHNIFGNIAIIALSVTTILSLIIYKKCNISIFFIVYLLFILYNFFIIEMNFVKDYATSMEQLKTLILNFVVLFFLYNLLIFLNDTEKFMKIYINSSVFSLGLIIFMLRKTLFLGRLGHAYGEDSISYYFMGLPIAISSNSIAFYCSIALLFSLFFFYKYKNKRFIISSLFLLVGILLTGSRKGIIIALFFIFYYLVKKYKKNVLKGMLYTFLIFLMIYLILTKVPVIYKIIGNRLEELIYKILFNSATNEGSISARTRYINYAFNILSTNGIFTFGYGLGFFKKIYGNVTENNYIELLIANGIIGFSLYYLNYFIIIIRNLINKRRDVYDSLFFIIIIALLFNDFGAVTYLSRIHQFLLILPIYYHTIKLRSIRKYEISS